MAIGRASCPMSGGMRIEMKKLLIVALLTALAACNTVAGLGEDVSGGARTVQNMMN